MNRSKHIIPGFTTITLSFLIFCGYTEAPMNMKTEMDSSKLSPKQLEVLASKKIYFGHQSVGSDIVDGMRAIIYENPEIGLKIVETGKGENIHDKVFAHSAIGNNGYPKSKIDDFADVIINEVGDKVNIAFMKLCYVDIVQSTDVDEIFKYYRDRMSKLHQRFPHVTFIHFTVPLTTERIIDLKTRLKDSIKRMIGRITYEEKNREDNVARQRFNQMMRIEYAGGKLFDLAEIESTRPTGEKETGVLNGENYNTLSMLYTTDGGHLNRMGQLIVADSLMVFLTDIFAGKRRLD